MDTIEIKLGFTAEELIGRRKYLGGSDANILMSGDEDKIHELWLRKTGQAEEADLSDVLPVQFGIFSEPLNVRWYERSTGRKVRSRNFFCPHPSRSFLACNLDGLTTTGDGSPAVFEAKCVNAFSNIEEVEQKYMAQIHHNMFCAEVEHAILSVFVGTLKYELTEVAMDDIYLCQLLDREKAFWECVESFTAPPRMVPIAAPVGVSEWREVDMTGSNAWATHAADWLASKDHATKFKTAEKELKANVAGDVRLATGHGVRISRSKAGALTIKEEKANG